MECMVGLQLPLYSVALALSVFCTGVLSQRRSRSGRPLRFFSFYLGIEALGFALELLTAHPDTPFKSLWLALLLGTSLFTAPMLWLALREIVTGESPQLRDLTWPHHAIIALGLICTLPLMASAHGASTWVNPHPPQRAWHYHYIHEAMLICIGLFAVQAPFYLRRSRRLLRDCAPAAARAWWHLPTVIVATAWVLGILRTLQCATHAPAEWISLFALVDVGVTVGALYLIVRQELGSPPTVAETVQSGSETQLAGRESKYAKSALDPMHVKRIRAKLERALGEQQLHSDSMLNLGSLSRSIGEKNHYVSQVINRDLGTTFYDLVNRARIDDARRQLRERPETTVLEIALGVGFNAKSTFNAAFKRHTGQTPRDYRENGSA